MADLTGHQLGNYRLVRHIGRGGFAEVYLGEHLYLKSEAALKVLLATPKGEEMERFLKEAQTLVGLRHPNIVRVLEFGVEGDIPFLVTDYAPGGTVRYRYPTGSRLPLTTAVAYVKQVAAALQYAHNRGIIHRDVKPENILLDFDQHILLSDFGLALFAPSPELLSTQEGAGTAPYIPPEQLQGKPTFTSDQYSLGIVTYEWLSGKRPFEGNYWALINQHVYAAPAPLRQICPELPAAVETVVLRALAKDPQQRFVSVQAYAFALEQASRENIVAQDVDSEVTATLIAVSPSSEATLPHSPYSTQAQHRVFLISTPADEAFAARLQADLQECGALVSNAHLAYVPDANQQDTLRQVIRDAQMALVVVSPHTRSSRTVKEQLRIAGMYQRHLVFVWAAGDNVASVLPETWGRTAMIDLVDARETRYRDALDEIIAFLEAETPLGATEEPTLPVPPGEPRNPYKGLHAYTRDDAADFFGRDTLIVELAETIEGFLTAEKPTMPASRLLTVIGPSGSGKSSVVMAGLLPELQKSALPGSEAWVYLDPIKPGKRPLESLILAFAPRLPKRSLRAIRHDLEDDSARGLHLLATQLVKRPGVKVVLMIDQFEELFTQTLSEQERQRYIDLLVAAVTEPHGPLIVLLTLRADFYDRPMHYLQLSQLIEAHHKSVLPMNPHELRAVIEQPAVLPDVQLLFEGTLVGDLLFEAQGQAGALPLLEFTLDQLFHLRDGHWLTRKAYQQIGGVKGALAKHAESTYASLPSEEYRRLARALFLRLIDPGVTEQDTTRRRASLAELSLPDSEQTKIMHEVADTFVAARLLMTNEMAGTTTIEVSHEALIREWARLAGWVLEAREDIVLQKALHEDAAEWVRRGKPVDRLHRGDQLTEAQAWAERNVPTADEAAFLQVSAAERQQQEELELSRQARELQLQRRVVSRQRILITALSLFSLIVILLGSFAGFSFVREAAQHKLAVQAQQTAEAETKIARSRALVVYATDALAQNQLDRALLLSVEASKIADTSETRNNLISALEKNPQIITMLHSATSDIRALVFSPDGSMLVSSDAHAVYIWNWKTPTRKPRLLHLGGGAINIGGAALSSDDRTLAFSNVTGVWLWDTQTDTQIALLEGRVETVPANLLLRTSIAFSPDGKLVASARCSQYDPTTSTCVETQIHIWNVLSKVLFGSSFPVHGNVNSVTFSTDSTLLAYSSDTSTQVWNVVAGQPSDISLAGNTGANSVAFSSDGKILAAGNKDGVVQLWDILSGTPVTGSPLSAHTGPITSLIFSPGDKTLAASSTDGTIQLWSVASGLHLATFNGDGQPKTKVIFSPDGGILASGSENGTLILWNVQAESTISQRVGDIGGWWSALFSPDGAILFTGSDDGKIFLQDAKTGKLIKALHTISFPLRTPKNGVGQNLRAIDSLALSGDGGILASGRADGTIILWNTKTRASFAQFVYPSLLDKIVLSSNGQFLVAGGGDTIRVWNVAKRAFLYSLPYQRDMSVSTTPIALSHDGKLLAVGGCGTMKNGGCEEGQVQLWDVASGKSLGQPLLGLQSVVKGVAFSPDGTTLASSSQEGILLWNLSTRERSSGELSILPTDNNTYSDYYGNLLFSPNGKMLASYSSPGIPLSFVLWDVRQNEAFAPAFTQKDTFGGSIAFNPNGTQLASVIERSSGEVIFTLWDITIRSWQDHACIIANRDLTEDEWKQFIGDERYSKVCQNLST